MATPLASRYRTEDFETASIRSAAPSYISEAPSYHSTAPITDASPVYTPATNRAVHRAGRATRDSSSRLDQRSIGLPPIPPLPPQNTPSLHNFIRIATWSTTNAPVARHYRSVAERRVTDGRYQPAETASRRNNLNPARVPEEENRAEEPFRPLEDPYLVGEEAAAEARRDRIARETGEDILIKEDQQWDWLIATMKDWDHRDKTWAKFRHTRRRGRLGLLHR